MEPQRRTRLQATALLAVTFAVGALVGAAGDRVFTGEASGQARAGAAQQEQREGERGSSRGNSRPRSFLLAPGVLDSLGATTEQRARIMAILERRDTENKKLWDSIEPSMRQLMDQTRQELRNQLTTEQQAKLDRIIKERRDRMKEQDRHRGSNGKSRPDSAKR